MYRNREKELCDLPKVCVENRKSPRHSIRIDLVFLGSVLEGHKRDRVGVAYVSYLIFSNISIKNFTNALLDIVFCIYLFFAFMSI